MAKLDKSMPRLRLRLYIAGRAPNSVRAIANCQAICDEHFASGHELEIVDLLEHPHRALADGVIGDSHAREVVAAAGSTRDW